jgi:hypothetical protein
VEVSGVNNVTGGLFAVVFLLLLMVRRPSTLLLVPVSLVVVWDYGLVGVAALWTIVVLAERLRLDRRDRSTVTA